MKPKPHISIVIPVHNEAGNIAGLDAEIKNVAARLPGPIETIYVNDGSTDTTLAQLKALKHVSIVDLNRNYGQAVALDAGFKASTGEFVVSLYGDGQNDPADIPAMLAMLEAKNLDVVAGWRKSRSDKKGIRVLTRIGRFLRRLLIADIVHDSGCTLRVYRRTAVESLEIHGEMHRYIIALLRWKGFTVGEMAVGDRARQSGESHYGYDKAIRGFIDLIYIWFIYKYSQRPLHLFGYVSLGLLFFGVFAAIVALYQKVWGGLGLTHNGWFFLAIFCFITTVLFFSFGIVIDLLIRIHLAVSHNERRYYVREVIRT